MESEGFVGAGKCLDFIGYDGDVVFFADFHDGFMEARAAWVETAFTLDEFHDDGSVLAWVAVDVLIEFIDGCLGAFFGVFVIEEGDVVD